MTTPTHLPSPEIVFDTLFAYQRSAALGSAIELELFTAIHDGARDIAAIADRCRASERGMRMLCDFLVSIGLLTKTGGTYDLTPDTATFLSQRSPAYLGTMARFLLRPELKGNFESLMDAVRRGGVSPSGNDIVAPS